MTMQTKRRVIVALGLLLFAGANPALAAGAIAVDSENGQRAGDEGYGIGWGQSRADAAEDALKKCKDAGNDACRVVARFDTCGAFASDRSTYGVGWGSTEADAKAMALSKCDNCRIVIAECE
jgi:hypothetical protein